MGQFDYNKTEAKRFLKRTKRGWDKMLQGGHISANQFVKRITEIDQLMKKLK
tara:strand:+ start:54 stop:209 length:156 start_codon:yes stop_codon:yes gene_type:complete